MELIDSMPKFIILLFFFGAVIGVILMSSCRRMLQWIIEKQVIHGIPVKRINEHLFISKFYNYYRTQIFLSSIIFTYIIGLVFDSITKPPFGTIFSIILSVIIGKSSWITSHAYYLLLKCIIIHRKERTVKFRNI